MTTLNQALDRYVEEVLPGHGERTQRDYLRHIQILRRQFGEFDLDSIEPRDIGEFLNVRKGKISKNRQVAVLSAVYSKCVGRWYYCKVNPCSHVERNPTKPRTRYITDDEYLAIYQKAPMRVQVAMDLALLTGQRQADILGLKWEHVSREGIFFQQGKTGKKLLVEPSTYLGYVVARAKREINGSEFVIETREGKRYTSEGFRAKWQRVRRLAIKSGLMKLGHTFHDIRAKSVSDSQSLEEAMARAGHTTMAMTRGVYDRGVRRVKPLYG